MQHSLRAASGVLTKGWLTGSVCVPSLNTCALTCDRVCVAVDLVQLLHTRRFSFILSHYRYSLQGLTLSYSIQYIGEHGMCLINESKIL